MSSDEPVLMDQGGTKVLHKDKNEKGWSCGCDDVSEERHDSKVPHHYLPPRHLLA